MDRKTSEKKKKNLILGDSIVKNIEGRRLNKVLKSSVSINMIRVVKGCFIDCLPEVIILHHSTNDV